MTIIDEGRGISDLHKQKLAETAPKSVIERLDRIEQKIDEAHKCRCPDLGSWGMKDYLENEGKSWFCPIHGTGKIG